MNQEICTIMCYKVDGQILNSARVISGFFSNCPYTIVSIKLVIDFVELIVYCFNFSLRFPMFKDKGKSHLF